MVVPTGGVDKRRQPLPPGLLHHHVQRFRMVSASNRLSRRASLQVQANLTLWQRLHQPN
jgi:hypothetical protein